MVHVLLGREALCARVYRVQQGIALLCWGAVLLCLGADAHQVMYAPGGGLTVAGHQFAVRHSGYVYGRVVARLAGGDACRRDIAGPGLASWPTRVLPTPGKAPTRYCAHGLRSWPCALGEGKP